MAAARGSAPRRTAHRARLRPCLDRQILREWNLNYVTDSTELLVPELELTTNALQASAPIADATIGLWLASDCERAVILVWDSSPQPQPPTPANPGQGHRKNGRDLLLVQTLSLK
jgi:hypothetical protein